MSLKVDKYIKKKDYKHFMNNL